LVVHGHQRGPRQATSGDVRMTTDASAGLANV
jgi:hypothetical protein